MAEEFKPIFHAVTTVEPSMNLLLWEIRNFQQFYQSKIDYLSQHFGPMPIDGMEFIVRFDRPVTNKYHCTYSELTIHGISEKLKIPCTTGQLNFRIKTDKDKFICNNLNLNFDEEKNESILIPDILNISTLFIQIEYIQMLIQSEKVRHNELKFEDSKLNDEFQKETSLSIEPKSKSIDSSNHQSTIKPSNRNVKGNHELSKEILLEPFNEPSNELSYQSTNESFNQEVKMRYKVSSCSSSSSFEIIESSDQLEAQQKDNTLFTKATKYTEDHILNHADIICPNENTQKWKLTDEYVNVEDDLYTYYSESYCGSYQNDEVECSDIDISTSSFCYFSKNFNEIEEKSQEKDSDCYRENVEINEPEIGHHEEENNDEVKNGEQEDSQYEEEDKNVNESFFPIGQKVKNVENTEDDVEDGVIETMEKFEECFNYLYSRLCSKIYQVVEQNLTSRNHVDLCLMEIDRLVKTMQDEFKFYESQMRTLWKNGFLNAELMKLNSKILTDAKKGLTLNTKEKMLDEFQGHFKLHDLCEELKEKVCRINEYLSETDFNPIFDSNQQTIILDNFEQRIGELREEYEKIQVVECELLIRRGPDERLMEIEVKIDEMQKILCKKWENLVERREILNEKFKNLETIIKIVDEQLSEYLDSMYEEKVEKSNKFHKNLESILKSIQELEEEKLTDDQLKILSDLKDEFQKVEDKNLDYFQPIYDSQDREFLVKEFENMSEKLQEIVDKSKISGFGELELYGQELDDILQNIVNKFENNNRESEKDELYSSFLTLKEKIVDANLDLTKKKDSWSKFKKCYDHTKIALNNSQALVNDLVRKKDEENDVCDGAILESIIDSMKSIWKNIRVLREKCTIEVFDSARLASDSCELVIEIDEQFRKIVKDGRVLFQKKK